MPHTPEPWYIGPPLFVREIYAADQLIALIHRYPGSHENAELMVRAPRLARVLNTLLTEVSDGFSSAGTTPMALAMQDAAALVRELREAGVL